VILSDFTLLFSVLLVHTGPQKLHSHPAAEMQEQYLRIQDGMCY
jgi:hypothetical protein